MSEKAKLTPKQVETLIGAKASFRIQEELDKKQKEEIESPEKDEMPMSESMKKDLTALTGEISNLTNPRKTNDPVTNAQETKRKSGEQTKEDVEAIGVGITLTKEDPDLAQEASNEYTGEESKQNFEGLEGAIEQAMDMNIPIEDLIGVISRLVSIDDVQKAKLKKIVIDKLDVLTDEQAQLKNEIEKNEAKMEEEEAKSDKIIALLLDRLGVNTKRYKRVYNALTKIIYQLNTNNKYQILFLK